MRRRVIEVGVTTILGMLCWPLHAESQSDQNGPYSAFNPVPAAKLRDLSTDRPGKSHSAITVDAGHFQVESDFVNVIYDPKGQGTTAVYSVATPILKWGVTERVDVELGLTLFNRLRQTRQDENTSAEGFGDTLLGSKVNIFGKDGGAQSLAVLPFVKIPTGVAGISNLHAEFTVNAPYTIAAMEPWSLTLEPNFGIIRNDANSAYTADYGLIANLSRPILIKGLTAAVEVAVDTRSDKEPTRWSFDPSLQYMIGKNLQFDIGVYLGLNRATPRYNPYIGVSFRY